MKYLCIFLFQFLIFPLISGQIWTQIHDLGVKESGFEINALEDGNFIISGKEWGFNDNSSKYHFVKVNPAGELLWNKVYQFGHGGGSYSNIFTFVLPEDQGYYIIGGSYEMKSSNSYGDIFITRLNSQGDSLWTKNIIGTEDNELLKSASTINADEQFIFLYSSRSSNSSSSNYYIAKVGLNGNLIWNHKLAINSHSAFYSLIPSSDGNFIASGYRNTSNSKFDALAVKISSNGSVVWEKTYGNNDRNFFFDLEINKSGNLLFFGSTGFNNSKGFYVVETDWNGVVLSEKVISSPNGGILALPHPRMEVLKLSSQNFIIVADSQLGSCGDDDSQIYWLDSDGNYINNTIFGTPNNHEILYNAVQCHDGNILLVGGSNDGLAEYNLLLAKFEKEYTTNAKSITIQNDQIDIYPNPFFNLLHFKIPDSIQLPLKGEIVDVNGKVLSSELITQKNANMKISDLSKGIYFLILHNEIWNKTIKIVRN